MHQSPESHLLRFYVCPQKVSRARSVFLNVSAFIYLQMELPGVEVKVDVHL